MAIEECPRSLDTIAMSSPAGAKPVHPLVLEQHKAAEDASES
jgi:hypothetical protein